MSTDLESIAFDHYQRYAAAAALVDALAVPVVSVLEVGANRQRLLASFLPHKELVFSDLFMQPGVDDFVQADASALPFADGTFDVVVALDVFEHMPVHLRPKAAAEMTRVAARLVVIACPLDHPWVHAAEQVANDVWRNYFDEDYPWLEEHKEFGLVSGDEIERALVGSGCAVLRFGQGDTAIWSGLMSAHFIKEAVAEIQPIVASADRLYNHSVFAGDRSEKSYREYFVAARKAEDLEQIRRSPLLTAKMDEAAVALLSSLGKSLQPVADRVRFAESQWQTAAERVAEGDAKLSSVAAEWGHTVELLHESERKQSYASEQWAHTAELLRESEQKQLYASEQWHTTAELVLATEAQLTLAREQWAHTVDLLRESERKQLYVSEQWHATAELVQTAEASLIVAKEQWALTADLLRESERSYLHVTDQWQQAVKRGDRLVRRLRWALGGGIVILLVMFALLYVFLT